MRRIWILLLILALAGLPLYAQEDGDEPGGGGNPPAPPIESDWDAFTPDLYARGDKTFVISLGVLIPTVFTGSGLHGNEDNIKLGGTGSLAFNYFLGAHLFVGGELGGMFASTLGKNMLFIVPFGLRVGYQFIVKRFEFPISLMIGASPTKYLDQGYFGMIIKPGASAYFRFNSDWSFGLNTNWWMVPQWPKDGENVFGNFLEVTLSARYHF
ncbi:TP0733 family outer membrane beta-barrel protein [Leadbettera azotonutricia]|uniref:Outer membrane protein beta-barrel domain-containing protein n=1 Tax=Leadbettera azotonutricia (strain ATCC BAA-888 / DSM 13862 / ZAS-9) TaxID=545695 RepID=F5YDH8_LEAAZ|nr:hypothetical protein [Leadbettera azotonutricia]AEF81926.1 conserved hypothetical protein [Leadbettera azotonutricia ZAS-9]